jgi:hypothetical protein
VASIHGWWRAEARVLLPRDELALIEILERRADGSLF